MRTVSLRGVDNCDCLGDGASAGRAKYAACFVRQMGGDLIFPILAFARQNGIR